MKNLTACLRRVGEFQARVLLTLVYLAFIWPMGFLLRLFSDPLSRRQPSASNWRDRGAVDSSLAEWIKRQY